MNDCAHMRYRQSKKKLDNVVAGLMKMIRPEGRVRLQNLQKTWLEYSRARCDFESMGTEGGSVNSMMYTQCLRQLTEEQSENLARQFTCDETPCGGHDERR